MFLDLAVSFNSLNPVFFYIFVTQQEDTGTHEVKPQRQFFKVVPLHQMKILLIQASFYASLSKIHLDIFCVFIKNGNFLYSVTFKTGFS